MAPRRPPAVPQPAVDPLEMFGRRYDLADPVEAVAALMDLFGAEGASHKNAQRSQESRLRSTRHWPSIPDEILVQEGLAPARRRKPDTTTPKETQRLLHAEVEQAGPVARRLVQRIRLLWAGVLPRPPKYEQVWREIIDEWDAALQEGSWIFLRALCKGCGQPIYCRAAGPRGLPSITCGDLCRDAQKKRQRHQRRK